jgi:hypothetical protein
MKAEIPFAFHVGKQVMQPGEYRVSLVPSAGGFALWQLANYDSHQATLVMAESRTAPSKEWAAARTAKLSFTCGDGPCTLNRIWSGDGDAYQFRTPRGKDGEPHIAEITMRPERAD